MRENKENTIRPFGMRDKIGYMFGDFANDFMFVLATLFLMKFYTDVMGISAALVGAMMMIVKFVDAFTDVAMGQIVDRSPRTAKGKFAPWIRRMCGPVALASFLMYATWFKDMPMGFKIFWMFFTYLLWGSVCYTGVNIPYGSMASAVTSDPKERAELSTFRTIGASLATAVIGVALPLLVYYTDENGNKALSGTKVSVAAAVCSCLAIVCYLICYHLSTERVKIEPKQEKFNLKQLIVGWGKNKALIVVMLFTILLGVSNNTLSGMSPYIYPNYFGNTKAQSVASAIGILVTLICSTFVVPLSMKLGRKKLAVISGVFSGVMMLIAFFVHTDNAWVFVMLYGLSYAGCGVFALINWALIGDVIDDSEVRTGIREDGNIYSVYSFSRKMSQALATGLVGAALSAIGYTTATAYDTQVVNNIYNVTCLIPAIGFLLISVVIQIFYPLDKERVAENARILTEKNKNKDEI
ncbi:MAG: MFS transporter [Eubacterium sp.]